MSIRCELHGSEGLGACPRCGSFVCANCLVDGQGLVCAKCRALGAGNAPSRLNRWRWTPFWAIAVPLIGGFLCCLSSVPSEWSVGSRGGQPAIDDPDAGPVSAPVPELQWPPPRNYGPAVSQRVTEDLEVVTFDGTGAEEGGLFTFGLSSATEQALSAKRFFQAGDAGVAELSGSMLNIAAESMMARGRTSTESRSGVAYAVIYGTASLRSGALNFGMLRDGKPNREPMLHALLYFECQGDDSIRLGVWTRKETLDQGVDPNSLPPASLRGTVGDEAEIEKLVSGFSPCR